MLPYNSLNFKVCTMIKIQTLVNFVSTIKYKIICIKTHTNVLHGNKVEVEKPICHLENRVRNQDQKMTRWESSSSE